MVPSSVQVVTKLNRFDGRRVKAGVNVNDRPPLPLPLELTALPENRKSG